jgi:hypothetical protein
MANNSPMWQSATSSLYRNEEGHWVIDEGHGSRDGKQNRQAYICGFRGDDSHPDSSDSWHTYNGTKWIKGVEVKLIRGACEHTDECTSRKEQATALAAEAGRLAARI